MNFNRRWLAAALTLAVGACSEPQSSPVEPQFSVTNPSMVECPSSVTDSVSGLIGPLGGVLTLDGSSVTIPLGAVLVPTTITFTIPASNYMEIDVHAAGVEHYQFEKPISVTVDYSRCTRSDIEKTPLTIWYIDSNTHQLLQDMGGVDDKVNHTVTFGTPHLSGYVIAD